MVLVLALEVAAVAVVSFLVGAVNPATLVARALGRDLRVSGSGNPGATNAGRVLGRRWGVLVLLLDVAKAYLPTVLVLRSVGLLAALVAGLAVVLGHVYSPFLRGRGGKGVACALGAILAVVPLVGLVAVVVFGVAVALVRYIGEASVVVTLALVVIGVLGLVGVLPWVEPLVGAWLVVLALLVLSRHRRNVVAWWARRRT
ncbi:glycerol-3-phosphate acyltransferase [Phycicoccus sonneratiae]|uniref:Glycerol-3-phosphate acyltransferase n=1 Tax=Phycicoccus sonneratiae TaxID=2807628 RepID=A0ABS2CKB4_9MICO|nr:glycerol-3-phosphate acyltransferase [Phycicoccus sonneraticus]MBM6400304.1 glycerol-3-phosphate acyltransferase [Phycicoccus sonneraticus]